MKATFVVAALFALLACPPASAGPATEQLLEESGLRGGLVVQLGCGNEKLNEAILARNAGGALVVQAIDSDPAKVRKARAAIESAGLAGRVSAVRFDGRRLPYAENMVNLLVADGLGDVSMAELMRVLVPGGVAYVRSGDQWARTPKPWPADVDEWTHYLHGPDNNAVSEDMVVGPPRRLQWISGPRFSRSHDHLASVSTVVSAGGRIFYIVDEGSIAFAAASPRWRLVARDAFNGVRLWDRKISSWEYHLRDFRSGPAEIARRLVAVGDRVYVTLGYGEPVTALDATTGETVRTYAGTEGTQEILFRDGTLFLVLGQPEKDWPAETAKEIVSQDDYFPPFERYTPPAGNKSVMAVDAESGKVAWRNAEPYAHELMPSTLAVAPERVYFESPEAIVCLDAATGEPKWQTPRSLQRRRLAWSTPTLVVYDGVVFSADRRAADTEGNLLWLPSGGFHQYIRGDDVQGQLIALDGETGKQLWSCGVFEGFNAPVDVLIADGLVWTGRYAWGNDPGITEARAPRTGEVVRRRPSDLEFLGRVGHARCHRARATEKYLLLGRRGIELVDVKSGRMTADFWVRGICQYGYMPANGLLYVPPHSCACNVDDLLKVGFIALAPARHEEATDQPAAPSLEKGPAYGHVASPANGSGKDWPTYRHDPARSGATPDSVSHDVQVAWQTDVGGNLSSPVIADGVLLVAETDAHRVQALDAATGRKLWTFAAGARIDSSPTIADGRVLFGSADGRVYCLRLADGALVWQFRAAPHERQIIVDDQLESAWPVSGSVLVADGAAYFTAGRSSHADGGMTLYKLDAATGETLDVLDLAPETKQGKGIVSSAGYLPDILAADGDSIFMRNARFDLDLAPQKGGLPHLWSSSGLLDASWWHRTYWQIGNSMGSGWGGWPKAGQQAPAGRLLVSDGSRVFGFGRNQYDIPGAHVGIDAAGVWGPIAAGQGRWTSYRLFGQAINARSGKQARRQGETPAADQAPWSHRIPVLGQAIILAGDTLFVAGPPDTVKEIPHDPAEVDPLADALEAKRGGRLMAVSAGDGKTLSDVELESPPVFDGMAAAGGRLYLSTKLGQIVCMGPAGVQ